MPYGTCGGPVYDVLSLVDKLRPKSADELSVPCDRVRRHAHVLRYGGTSEVYENHKVAAQDSSFSRVSEDALNPKRATRGPKPERLANAFHDLLETDEAAVVRKS